MTDTGSPAAAPARSPMLDLLAGFINELREAGLPVSLTENLDAMEAVTHIPIEDRDAFKYALAATLVKNNAHWRAFETVFEVYFSLRGAQYAIGDEGDELSELLDDLEGEAKGDQGARARAWARRGRRRRADARGAGRDALPGADAGRRRADAGHRPPGGEALRRHGAGPAGRRHLLPVPHAAEPRPRRRARPADAAGPRAGGREGDRSRRSRSGSSRTSSRSASTS